MFAAAATFAFASKGTARHERLALRQHGQPQMVEDALWQAQQQLGPLLLIPTVFIGAQQLALLGSDRIAPGTDLVPRSFLALEEACAFRPDDSELQARQRITAAYEALRPELPSFGSRVGAALPLPANQPRMAAGDEFERLTGLPPRAFAPRGRDQPSRGLRLAPLEAAAGLVVGQLLTFGGVLDRDELPRKATELAQLQSYELISLVLSILLGVTTIVALVDKLLLQERLLEALGLLLVPSRREAAARHEAGHFLCAYLLAVPVQACMLNPARSLFDSQLSGRVGTVFLSPAMSELRAGRPADRADVDVASIVLMGGIAAEALVNGSAEGGAADERALAALLTAQEARSSPSADGSAGTSQAQAQPPEPKGKGFFSATGLATSGSNTAIGGQDADGAERAVATPKSQQADIRARARWAAACAAILLRERRASFDALVQALREGRSVGECVWAIETAAPELERRTEVTETGAGSPDATSAQRPST